MYQSKTKNVLGLCFSLLFSLQLIVTPSLSASPTKPKAIKVAAAKSASKADKVVHTEASIDGAIEQLIAFEYRPEMSDMIRAFGGQLPDSNPFLTQYVYKESMQQNLDIIRDDSPKAIAALEIIYPGASYFQLGRDGAIVSDILETFFNLIGQEGRVHRLNASGPTVRALNSKTGPEFLISNGLLERPGYPILFIDNTSWNNGSQSYLLTKFAEKVLMAQGLTTSDLEQLLTTASFGSGWQISAGDDDAAIAKLKKDNYLKTAVNFLGNLGTPSYSTGYWNDSMSGTLVTMPNGRLGGSFTNPFGKDEKLEVLAHMYEVYRIVTDPQFLENVKHEASLLGRTFDAKANTKRIAIKMKSQSKVLAENFANGKERLEARSLELIHDRLMGSDNGSRDEADVKIIKEMLGAKPVATMLKAALAIAKEKKMYMVSDEALTLALDKFLPPTDDQFVKLKFILTRLPLAEQGEGYFSPNGSLVKNWIKKVHGEANLTNDQIIKAISLVFAGQKNKVLTPKDRRRLVLRLLSYVKIDDKKELSIFGEEIASNAVLEEFLTRNAEVFITSERFDKRAQEVYLSFVKSGFLQEPKNCKELLNQKKDKEKKK